MGIEKMLRMYRLQSWFSLSDEGVGEAIYDSNAFCKFTRFNFAEEQVPDATTLLNFHRIIEENKIAEKLFNTMNKAFEEAGFIYRGGTIVDATIIATPSSTKNEKKEREPEMHQTKKGRKRLSTTNPLSVARWSTLSSLGSVTLATKRWLTEGWIRT